MTSYQISLTRPMTDCPICLKSIVEPFHTSCNHVFHEECIETWFQLSHKCPMCRESKFNQSPEAFAAHYHKTQERMDSQIALHKNYMFKID
jgi:phage FluMu protein Com